jgi:hypothetical protein
MVREVEPGPFDEDGVHSLIWYLSEKRGLPNVLEAGSKGVAGERR